MNEKLEWFEITAERVEMLEQENALKLKQILDLEQILWDTHIIDLLDSSPCWCCLPDIIGVQEHDDVCIKARQATEMFWKGIKANDTESN